MEWEKNNINETLCACVICTTWNQLIPPSESFVQKWNVNTSATSKKQAQHFVGWVKCNLRGDCVTVGRCNFFFSAP